MQYSQFNANRDALPPSPSWKDGKLTICIVISLLLHAAILFLTPVSTKKFSVVHPHPLTVSFDVPLIVERSRIPAQSPTSIRDAQLPTSLHPQSAESLINSQPILDSAQSIVRDEAVKYEQRDMALAKSRLNTPIASMEQYLRQPHQEIRLANGMLKIITTLGEVCFQPVPEFARDDLSKGVFGIPSKCP